MDLPKLIAFDVDGTLIEHDGTCTERTREALVRLRQTGVATAIATGRPRASIGETLNITGPVDYAICGNGNTVTQVASGRLLHDAAIPDSAVAPLVNTIRMSVPGVGLAAELSSDVELEEAGFAQRIPMRRAHPDPVADVLTAMGEQTSPVRRLMFFHPDFDGDIFALARLIEPHLPNGCGMYCGIQLPLVEVLPAGQNKGVAVANLADHLGLTASEVMVFGDGTNDIEMFQWAGRGIAMGPQCHPDLLAVAASVTDPVSDDGVANHLERVFGW